MTETHPLPISLSASCAHMPRVKCVCVCVEAEGRLDPHSRKPTATKGESMITDRYRKDKARPEKAYYIFQKMRLSFRHQGKNDTLCIYSTYSGRIVIAGVLRGFW